MGGLRIYGQPMCTHLIMLSSDAEARVRQSGPMATLVTESVWPSRVALQSWGFKHQTLGRVG